MKNQEEKSHLHISLQPKDIEKNSVQLIMALDISGYGTNEIAAQLDMSVSRVSIVKNSPLYKEERAKRFESLKTQIIDKKSTQIVESPAMKHFAEQEEASALNIIDLANNSKSEFVKLAANKDVLGYRGIVEKKKEDKGGKTIVLEEKIAKRFGFAKGYSEEVSQRVLTVTQE